MFDLAIIGGGPAGMTAAIYAANAGIKTVVLESLVFGGQMATTSQIQNYPSIKLIDGAKLSSNMKEQIDSLHVTSIYTTVISIEKQDHEFEIITTAQPVRCKSVIIANGVSRRKLGIKGEEQFSGKGVSWCAVCDGGFFKNKDVAVIGGANSAMREALHLSSVCRSVHLIYRRDNPTAEQSLIDAVKATDNIIMMPNTIVCEICGDKSVQCINIKNIAINSTERLNVSGVFEAVGLVPDNDKFKNIVELSDDGYILTDENCRTTTDGVYAAGDTRKKQFRQIITACSDGAICACQISHRT